MNMVKVSVVVPVYKVEKYIRQCVDSIINQSLKEIEIILVDDGSPDECPEILDEYSLQDNRIKVIHQKNQGYGKAVNAGINASSGEYVCIVESDDWIDEDMLSKLYKKAKAFDADIARCGFYIYDSTKSKKDQDLIWEETKYMMNYNPDGVFSPMDFPENFVFHSAIWSFIYKRSLLEKIKFDEQTRAYHDFPFMTEMLATVSKMVVVKECLHHYRMEQNSGSTTMTKSVGAMQMINMTKLAKSKLIQKGVFEQVQRYFYKHAVIANSYFYTKTPDEYQKKYFDEMHLFFKNCSFDFSNELDQFTNAWYLDVKNGKNFYMIRFKTKAKEKLKRFPIIYGLVRRCYSLIK